MKNRGYRSLWFVVATIACAGGGGGGLAGDGGANPVMPGASGGAPPNFSYEPEGDAQPPTIDEALATALVFDSATLVATGDEDTLTLANGFEMIVPAGALAPGDTVEVRQVDFSDAPPGVTDAVYTFTASAQPTSAVTMTFPIPGDTTDLTNHNVYVAWHHEQDTAITLEGTIDDVSGTIQVTTDGFSVGVVSNEGEMPEPPLEVDHIIKMPYYNQGSSGNCWSVAASMLLSGYLDGDEMARKQAKTWHVNEFFHLNAEHGYSFYPFVYGPDIRDFMTNKVPGISLERHVWFIVAEETKLKHYLIDNVLNDEPTMVYVKDPEAHMLLVVGYQQDGTLERFIIHDPATNAYTTMLWHELRNRFTVAGFDQAATLSLGVPVSQVVNDASILVPFAQERYQGVDFIGKRPNGTYDLARASVFSWYIEAAQTYGFVYTTSKQPASMRKEDLMYMTVEVARYVHPDAEGGMDPVEYQVGFEVIDPLFDEVIHASAPIAVSLRGGESSEIELAQGFVASTFAQFNGTYDINYFIEDANGTRHDEALISVTVTDPCGDGVCSEDDGEDETTCELDCNACGDGACQPDEVCEMDCHCGDGTCWSGIDANDPLAENAETCPEDCKCGDGICDPELLEDDLTASFYYCEADCHCGNGICDKGLYSSSVAEDENSCPEDCAACTDEICGFHADLCCGTMCCPEFTLGCTSENTCAN